MAAQSVDAVIQAKKLERDFSKVVLTLENVILPDEMLHPTPSMLDNLTYEQECDLRIYGCELIQTSGELLNLPQVAMATGQVVFQRFFYRKSFVKHNVEIVAMASIALSSKLEEAPRKIRDVINVFHHIKQVKQMKIITPMMLDSNYVNLKNQVIKAERRILKELGFCVHVKHPHKMIFIYLQLIECERNKRLVQTAWNYMNDSFRTDVFVRYSPETIACACIYLAARKLQICLPNNPPWWILMETNETDLQRIAKTILSLYSRKKANIEELETVVNNLRKEQNDARVKAKEARLLADEAGTRNGSAEDSNQPSPAVPAIVTKKDVYEERPTLTLGEELNRLRSKEKPSESDQRKSGLEDDRTSRKTGDSKEKLNSRNSYRSDRLHELRHSGGKSYHDDDPKRDRHRKDYKYASSKLDVERSEELVRKRSNGTERLTESLDGSDKYGGHHHHREKAKKRKRDRSPSPTSYKSSRQSRDYKYKYSNSRSPSPILYKESKHSRDLKYKRSGSKHESRH